MKYFYVAHTQKLSLITAEVADIPLVMCLSYGHQ